MSAYFSCPENHCHTEAVVITSNKDRQKAILTGLAKAIGDLYTVRPPHHRSLTIA